MNNNNNNNKIDFIALRKVFKEYLIFNKSNRLNIFHLAEYISVICDITVMLDFGRNLSLILVVEDENENKNFSVYTLFRTTNSFDLKKQENKHLLGLLEKLADTDLLKKDKYYIQNIIFEHIYLKLDRSRFDYIY